MHNATLYLDDVANETISLSGTSDTDIFNKTLECKEDFPVKDCENNFVIIRESNDTKIVQEKNCVFIQGEKENLTQITDEFLFNVFEIRV